MKIKHPATVMGIKTIIYEAKEDDLVPFEKRFTLRIRKHFAVILGQVGELIATNYLLSKGFKVCKINDHDMNLRLYHWTYDGDERLQRVRENDFRIPTIDMQEKWNGKHTERVYGYCKHIPKDLAENIWRCYASFREEHNTQFHDLLAHKDNKHYVVEVKTNKSHLLKAQRALLHSLEKIGLNVIVLRIKINPMFFIEKLIEGMSYLESLTVENFKELKNELKRAKESNLELTEELKAEG